MINWITNNWYVIGWALVAVVIVGLCVYGLITLSAEEQADAFREWLKYAVTIAEKELGGGTGQLKLRFVYDMFLEKFPWLSKIITFELFSEYVDDALLWLNNQLTSNKAVSAFVSKTTKQEEE